MGSLHFTLVSVVYSLELCLMCQVDSSLTRRSKASTIVSFIGTCLIAGLNLGALTAARFILPLVALSMGASGSLVGVIASVFTAIPMVFSVSFGRWVDRAGTLVPMLFAAGMVVVAAIAFWIVPSTYALIPIAGLIGAGGVFSHIAATRAVGAAGGESHRARSLGYLVLSYSLFQFLGPLIAGASYQYWGSFAAITTLAAFSLLSMSALGLRWHLFKSERVTVSPSAVDRRAYKLFSIPSLRSWIFICSVFVAAQSIYPFVISLYAVEIGLPVVHASWSMGAFAIGTCVSRFFGLLLAQRFEARSILKIALIMGALLYAVLPFVHDIYVLSVLSCAVAMPLGIGVPIALVMIYESAPQGRVNESVGLSMSMNNLLQTVLPLLFGISVSR